MTAAMGLGAVGGGLYVASRDSTGLLPLTLAAALFGVTILTVSLAPSLPWALVALLVTGFASTTFLATGNSTLQLSSGGEYRGRVMALWSVTFLGSTPVGGPVVGAVSEYVGPRWALGLGALACLTAAGLGAAALRRLPPDQRFVRATPERGGKPVPASPPEPPTLETELPEL